MPLLSAIDAINPAFERTKAMLFRPFRFKTWLKIGFIGWLAGAGTSASFNFRTPSIPQGPAADLGRDFAGTVTAWIHDHWQLIAVIVAFILAVVLGFIYVSCRFRFILFDSVLQRDAQIGRGWKMYSEAAQRYFAFLVAFMFASLAAIGIVIGVPLWRAYKRGTFSGNDPWAFLRWFLSLLLLVLAFAIISAIISSLAGDFGVPVLALDNATIGGAWRFLKQSIATEPWAFAGYLGMKLVLSIAFGIAVAIVGIFIFIILAIPAVILVVICVFIAKELGTAAAIILAILGALLAIAIGLIVAMMLSAPMVVFFTSYSLYFLGGRYSTLGALLWPQPPAQVLPPGTTPPPPTPPFVAPA